jgi:hypothetical protein
MGGDDVKTAGGLHSVYCFLHSHAKFKFILFKRLKLYYQPAPVIVYLHTEWNTVELGYNVIKGT